MGQSVYDLDDTRLLVAQAHFVHALFCELMADSLLARRMVATEASNILLKEWLIHKSNVTPLLAKSIVALVAENRFKEVDGYSYMQEAAREALIERTGEDAGLQFAPALYVLAARQLDVKYEWKSCCLDIEEVRQQSLWDFLATFEPKSKHTLADVRTAHDKYRAAVRENVLRRYELTQATVLEAPPEIRFKFVSEEMNELLTSHEALRYRRAFELVHAQEHFQQVRSKAADILSRHRRQGIGAIDRRWTKRLRCDAHKCSARLYYVELTCNYNWFPLKPEFMNAIAEKMASENLHTDALGERQSLHEYLSSHRPQPPFCDNEAKRAYAEQRVLKHGGQTGSNLDEKFGSWSETMIEMTSPGFGEE